jgi:flagellin-like hook-associated protein FlgL
MQRVRELTVQAANGTINESDRRSLGQEVDQLLQQMVGLANAQRAGRFLFGGTESGRPPFVIENDGGSTRVVYQGKLRRTADRGRPRRPDRPQPARRPDLPEP